jgi:hypothetical protein
LGHSKQVRAFVTVRTYAELEITLNPPVPFLHLARNRTIAADRLSAGTMSKFRVAFTLAVDDSTMPLHI